MDNIAGNYMQPSKTRVLQSFFIFFNKTTEFISFPVSNGYLAIFSSEYGNINDICLCMIFPVEPGIHYQFEKRVLWKTISSRQNSEVKNSVIN